MTAAVAALWRVTGLVDAHDLAVSTATEFIYQPGWFSIITALVAGAAGTLSLTSAKSAALVGVFIIGHHHPGRRQRGAGPGLRQLSRGGRLALQLVINLTGIVLAAYLVLLARGRARTPSDQEGRRARRQDQAG